MPGSGGSSARSRKRLRKDDPGLDTLLRAGGRRRSAPRPRPAWRALAAYLVLPAFLVAGLVSHATWLVVAGAVLCPFDPGTRLAADPPPSRRWRSQPWPRTMTRATPTATGGRARSRVPAPRYPAGGDRCGRRDRGGGPVRDRARHTATLGCLPRRHLSGQRGRCGDPGRGRRAAGWLAARPRTDPAGHRHGLLRGTHHLLHDDTRDLPAMGWALGTGRGVRRDQPGGGSRLRVGGVFPRASRAQRLAEAAGAARPGEGKAQK